MMMLLGRNRNITKLSALKLASWICVAINVAWQLSSSFSAVHYDMDTRDSELRISTPHQLLRQEANQTATSSPGQSSHQQRILLYITTHFSDQHLRYFHCCWPKLVKDSPLVRSAHIMIAATNTTMIDERELRYLRDDLFVNNPSYAFRTPPDGQHMNECAQYKKRVHGNDGPLKVSVNYKQCMANQGMKLGIEHEWIPTVDINNTSSIATKATTLKMNTAASYRYDWIIRLNPDVLIRSSKWLLQTLSTPSIQGIFISCGPKTRQLHTDFFAVRSMPSYAFSNIGRVRSKLNHERTAYQAFKHLLTDRTASNDTTAAFRFVPNVDPSQGICRSRGSEAPIYHVHDSCLAFQPTADATGEEVEQLSADISSGSGSGSQNPYMQQYAQLRCNALENWTESSYNPATGSII